MKHPHAVLALCALVGAAAPAGAAAAAQAGSASADVRGHVFDSTVAGPLEGARVLLWGTRHEATTDADGSFRIEGVPPGDYSAVFFHPRLTELGVASGSIPVTLRGAGVDLALAVPSRFTLLAASCAGVGGVAVAGRVFDASSELGLNGTAVRFEWLGAAGPAERVVETAEGGWYHACGLPPDTPVAVTASFLDRSARRREVRAAEGASLRLDLLLAPLRPARVTATVREAGSGAPVTDAVIRLGITGTRAVAESDGDGRATFDSVPPGHYTIEVEHLAHATRVASVDVPSGVAVAVRMEVSEEPIPLPPLEVTVEGFDETLELMGGIEVTPEEIEAVRARSRDVADLLHNQHIPGVIVKRGFSGDVCIEFLTGQVRMFKRTCHPVMVILDGVRLHVARDVFTLPASLIERLRLFRPVDAGTLFGLGAGSGVLVITTRARH